MHIFVFINFLITILICMSIANNTYNIIVCIIHIRSYNSSRCHFHSSVNKLYIVVRLSVLLIIVLTINGWEWTTKHQWTITKRMVTVTIVYVIRKAEF